MPQRGGYPTSPPPLPQGGGDPTSFPLGHNVGNIPRLQQGGGPSPLPQGGELPRLPQGGGPPSFATRSGTSPLATRWRASPPCHRVRDSPPLPQGGGLTPLATEGCMVKDTWYEVVTQCLVGDPPPSCHRRVHGKGYMVRRSYAVPLSDFDSRSLPPL